MAYVSCYFFVKYFYLLLQYAVLLQVFLFCSCDVRLAEVLLLTHPVTADTGQQYE